MGTGIVIESDEDMTGIDHPLRRLWMSSAEFLKRFDKYPGDKEAQRRVFNEEAYEFLCESIANEEILDELVAEAADVVVTVMTTLMAHGVSYSDFAAAIEQVAQKNDAKTHETHEINSQGKIARKK
jgi:phosphoribosyl-ATP pyrophosphohydrolase